MSSSAQFHCNSCGRKFSWKPELAGKKARCKCGSTIEVPKSVAQPKEADDLYDFADAPPPDLPRPAAASVVAPAAQPLNYQSAPTLKDRLAEQRRSNSMISKPRDIYAPLVMVVVGFLLVIGWSIFSASSGIAGAVVLGLILFVITVVKTIVLVLAAFGIASAFGVSFGTFWTAVLKLAAIVIFTEAMFFWIEIWMENIGAITSKGRVRGFSVIFLLQSAIFAVQFKLLFDMESDDLLKIGGVTALLSRIVDFGFKILIHVLLGA